MTRIQANDIAIEYEERGAPGDPVIIMVRGLGTQLIDWPRSMLDLLIDEGFRVVVFDNRDAGLSQKFSACGSPDLRKVASGESEAPYNLSDMAADVVGLMDALGIEKAHALGISLGGMIVQVLAAEHGDRLYSMISVMSSSSRPGLPAATREAAATLNAGPGTDKETVIAMTAEGLLICGSPRYPETLEQRLAIARQRYERDYSPDGGTRQMAAAVATGSREEMLNNILVPSLVIHGSDDPLIPVEAGIDTAKCVSGCKLEIINGMGHNIPETLVPVLTPVVIDFLKEIHRP